MKIEHNYNLSKLNTFGISAKTKFFVEIHDEQELKELFNTTEFKNNPKLFLGGGSNILLIKDFDGLVVLNKLKGIEIVKEDKENVFVRSMGGELWHDFVIFAVDRNYWGVENLSLIPGTIGAAPMQNIGAYGVELANVLENVEAYEIDTGEKKVFTAEECQLGYRDSIFKNSFKGKYFISAVTLKLSKEGGPNTEYRVLRSYLEEHNIIPKTSRDISEAVSAIRRSKLPDPKKIGNAGSFFKNVFVSPEKLDELLKTYPEMPHFEENGVIKIPTAWLIESCGLKGKRVDKVGVHDKQSLVLVNYGGATGAEIYNLSIQIIDTVFSKFGIKITPEVNLI